MEICVAGIESATFWTCSLATKMAAFLYERQNEASWWRSVVSNVITAFQYLVRMPVLEQIWTPHFQAHCTVRLRSVSPHWHSIFCMTTLDSALSLTGLRLTKKTKTLPSSKFWLVLCCIERWTWMKDVDISWTCDEMWLVFRDTLWLLLIFFWMPYHTCVKM